MSKRTRLERALCCAGTLLLLGAGLGCSGDDAPADTGNPFGNAGSNAGGTAGSGAAGESGTGASAGNGSGGGCLDCEICKHIDMIIAVDGSSSMTEELRAIRDDVFPAFADRLLQISGGIDDFRVGTLDACPNPADFHTRGNGGECNFFSGKPWIDSASPDVRGEFQCVGDIFQDDQQCSGNNDDEQPASAAAAALESQWATTANQGFSRADALLVVVAITDEDEQPTSSAQSAQAVYERIVAAKGGDPNRIVFLGIGGRRRCQGVYGTAEEATKLRNVTELFEQNGHGVFWDLCEGELQDGLQEAYEVIEAACNDLPPPPVVPPPYSDGPE